MKERQMTLDGIEPAPSWVDEWQDMPEFVQGNMQSIACVSVHFETVEDMNQFSELIGQTITFNTKGVFFPAKKTTPKEYVDEP